MPSRLSSEHGTLCVIALGGNLGDTSAVFRSAQELLEHGGFRIRRVSSFIRTAPENMPPRTPDFLNGVLSGYWNDSPEALLCLCRRIEEQLGRPNAHAHYVSRTLDLDLILFGAERIRTDSLIVPHPRARERSFVRIPLREIEPELEALLDVLTDGPEVPRTAVSSAGPADIRSDSGSGDGASRRP